MIYGPSGKNNQKIENLVSKINSVQTVIAPGNVRVMHEDVFSFYNKWYQKHRKKSYDKIVMIFKPWKVEAEDVKNWEKAYKEIKKFEVEWMLYRKNKIISDKKKDLVKDFQ